jgi:TetR/AcrR family transcriptional repressor of lmrAB and yxaGH operons
MNDSTTSTSRDRLIAAMADALQRKGLHGVGVSELLSQAASPKGVLYHHFPGGKTELAVAAIDRMVTRLEGSLAALAEQPEPLQALADWLTQAERLLRDSGFERGCPLATVALESTADDGVLRDALAHGFARLRQALSGLLERLGIAPPRAQALATLVLAAYEGALLQARVADDGTAMTTTTGLLLELLRHERNINNNNPESS